MIPTNNEQRKSWRRNWLRSLLDLSDLQLQQRWLDRRITNPAWSYVEFICSYFNDCGIDNGYDSLIRNGFVTQEEYFAIQNFHKALENYAEPNGCYDPQEILNDHKWQALVELGRRSALELQKIIDDPSEQKIFLEEAPQLTEGDFTWGRAP